MDQMKTLFEGFGPIQSVQVKTSQDGKCRGFGFITFASAESAEKAKADMNDKDIGGKKIEVIIAESKKKEGKGEEKGKGKGKGEGKGKGKGKKGSTSPTNAGYVAPYAYGQQPMPYGANQNQQMQFYQMQQMQQMAQYAMMQSMYAQQGWRGDGQVGAPFVPSSPTAAAVAGAAASQEWVGELKSISTKNGYGFITSPEIKKTYNDRDVYISMDLLPNGPDTKVGTKLKCIVGTNAKGHPQAKSCTVAE